MPGLLLMHESAFQIESADRLVAAGAIDSVVIEAGRSVPPERLTLRDLTSAIRAGLENVCEDLFRGPWRAAQQVVNLARRELYYGRRSFHDQRLLTHDRLDPRLSVIRVASINDGAVVEAIAVRRPEAIFVHGTSLIGPAVLGCTGAPFINLHWGWSPEYRGEGIVSALALEGPQALGVTVHLIDRGVDRGPVLWQARPHVDVQDNFYSIGVKLSLLGTEGFIRISGDVRAGRRIQGTPQDPTLSRLFSGAYMRRHPELYMRAWRRLRSAVAGAST